MRIVTALAAAALIGCGAALAAEPPAAPSATPVKHPSLKVCNKQADGKQPYIGWKETAEHASCNRPHSRARQSPPGYRKRRFQRRLQHDNR